MGNASETSLMRKTKAELVQIILRKDGVEVEKNEEIKALKSELKESKEKIVHLSDQLNYVNNELKLAIERANDFEQALDDAVERNICNVHKNRFKTIGCLICIVIAITAICISLF